MIEFREANIGDITTYFKWLNDPRSKAVVELTINNNEWVGLGIDMEEE